jgi:hypothetical protein
MNDPTRRSFSGDAGAAAGDLALADLAPFADQLVEIARHLRDAAIPLPRTAQPRSATAQSGGSDEPSRAQFLDLARRTYNLRRQRAAILGNPELFGEPAWDILLDLYIAHVEGKPVSVSSACIGSAAPPTTGLRWLGVLAEHDLILREPDPADQRRVMVRLTQRGVEAMERYFAAAATA